jgi:hypothetical protein
MSDRARNDRLYLERHREAIRERKRRYRAANLEVHRRWAREASARAQARVVAERERVAAERAQWEAEHPWEAAEQAAELSPYERYRIFLAVRNSRANAFRRYWGDIELARVAYFNLILKKGDIDPWQLEP